MSSHLKRIAKKLKHAPESSKPVIDDNGIATEFILRPDGQMVINRVQDIEDILKQNKAAFNNVSTKGQKFKGDMQKVASIPLIVLEKWMREGLVKNPFNPTPEDKKALKRLLNDPENRFLRTCPGTI